MNSLVYASLHYYLFLGDIIESEYRNASRLWKCIAKLPFQKGAPVFTLTHSKVAH